MISIKEQQKTEAVRRQKLLRVPKRVQEAFEVNGLVHLCTGPRGNYCLLTDAEAEQVKAFEQESGAMVYLITRAVTPFGVLDSYFFVGKELSDWSYERQGLDENYAYVYCVNQSHPECSECGDIFFAHTKTRGIVRNDIGFF